LTLLLLFTYRYQHCYLTSKHMLTVVTGHTR